MKINKGMIMSKAFLRLSVLCAPLLLTACGEGWEAQRTTEYVPYGNQRTAGSGVVYVRAKMLPKKELMVEPVSKKVEADVPDDAKPVLKAEEIFEEAQAKGASSKKKMPETKAPVAEKPAVEEDKHSSIIGGRNADDVVRSADLSVPSLSAEEYIAQAPKQIEIPEVRIVDSEAPVVVDVLELPERVDVSFVEPVAGNFEEKIVRVYENEVSQPALDIATPKTDYLHFSPDKGQESLDEIYKTPF